MAQPIKAVLDTPCSDAETTVAVEKFVEKVPPAHEASGHSQRRVVGRGALRVTWKALNAVEGMCIREPIARGNPRC